jgi:hypothetical protein
MKEWLRNLNEAAKEAARQMGAELKQMGAHGAHEIGACLYSGSGFVMYPRGTHDDVSHGLPQVTVHAPGTVVR